MDDLFTIFGVGGEEGVRSPPVKGVSGRIHDSRASTYLDTPGMRKAKATKDIPQAVVNEVVEVVRGKEEEDLSEE